MSQNPRLGVLFLTMIALIMAAISAFGHHGTGIAYNSSKPTVVKGIVTDFEWRNPHAQLFLDVKDESGNVQQYAVEMNSPGVMIRQGWTKHLIQSWGRGQYYGASIESGHTRRFMYRYM